jgi:uncharacterized protein
VPRLPPPPSGEQPRLHFGAIAGGGDGSGALSGLERAMPRAIVAAAAGIAGSLLAPAPAHAAGFDCARATRVDEVTICRTPSLSALDSEMSGLWYAYSRVPMLMGGNGDRGEEARAFLARRAACRANVACLTAAYRARIEVLHRGINAAMDEYLRMQNGN